MSITTKILASTNKCLHSDDIALKNKLTNISMLKNERLSFQLAYKSNGGRVSSFLKIESKLPIKAYRIDCVPVTSPGIVDSDYLSSPNSLYPDILTPIEDGSSIIAIPELHSIMFTIEDEDGINAGDYDVKVGLCVDGTDVLENLSVKVIDAVLPEQSLIHTQWFHNDCIASYYGCEIFSERHWELIGNYIEAAVRCGVNMLLTPVLTPPLDTAVGHQRPTVQLVDVKVVDGGYEFGYDKLERYISLALEKGIKYFEISHLFSQWGAIHAPKVVANVNGEVKQIFGWDTDATGEDYKTFIRAFTKGLLDKLKTLGVDKKCYFHISDEPNTSQLESYTKAKNLIADILDGYHIMDALSNYEFYETGAVETPIPSSSHIEPFLEHKVPDLWTYYCCGQANEVSNRFLAMPGQRTRILGEQLYKFDIKGFLQWGFNFWYTCGSLAMVNPYLDESGDNWVPAGDTFSVFPGIDGKAVYSLHALLFYEALQDMRALELLGSKVGRDTVVKLLDFGNDTLTFRHYSRTEGHSIAMRELVNNMIENS